MASSAIDHTVDVLVVGSGAGAMTAALAAAKAGLDTLIIEKADVYGGTSATSGGGLWITCNHLMPGVGIEVNPQDAEAYLTALTGNDVQPANVAVPGERGDVGRRHVVAGQCRLVRQERRADAAMDHGEQPCPVHVDA